MHPFLVHALVKFVSVVMKDVVLMLRFISV
jgi:hypothetical protein